MDDHFLFFDTEGELFTLYRSYPVHDSAVGTGIDIGEIIGLDYEITDAFETAKRLVDAELLNLVDGELISTEKGYELLKNGRVFVRYEISETPKKDIDFL